MGTRVCEDDAPFDVLHPIRLTLDDVRPRLGELSPIIHKLLPPSSAPLPDSRFATLVFAGRKPAMSEEGHLAGS